MDMNAVYECIGYGATRAVACGGFRQSASQIPARFILETVADPVSFCIDAYARMDPDAAAGIDQHGRALIMRRLKREAGLTRH